MKSEFNKQVQAIGVTTLICAILIVLRSAPATANPQYVPPADLVPSLGAPRMEVNRRATLRVNVRNTGGAYARTPWVRIYMSQVGNVERKWADLLGATNADCTQDDRRIDCHFRENLNGGSSQQIALSMRVNNVTPSNRHRFHIHADCGPVKTHHGGGLISESNEANNLIAPYVTIYRPADLRPTGFSSSYHNEVADYVYKNRDTTLFFSVIQHHQYVSASNVKVRIATPNIDVRSATATVYDSSVPSRNLGSRGFICSWSNSSRQINCVNGRLGSGHRVSVTAVVRAALFAPTTNSPVIVTADPDRLVREWNETNNTATYTVRIQ